MVTLFGISLNLMGLFYDDSYQRFKVSRLYYVDAYIDKD